MSDLTELEYPPQQAEASSASQSNKKLVAWLTFLRLFVLVIIAVLAVISTSFQSLKLGCLIGSILGFAALTIVEMTAWIKKPDKDWYDARVLTEAIKTLTWRYAARDNTFVGDSDAVDELYVARLKQTMDHFKSLTLLPGAEPESPITDWMKATRDAEFAIRKRVYLEQRLNDQIRWFSEKVKGNNIAYKRWSAILIFMYGAGVVCAMLEIADVIPVDVLGVIGALAASALAWVQGKQHASLAHEYSITCNNLRFLLPRFDSVKEDSWAVLVDDVEDELAREHSAWQAQRRKPNPA